MTLTRVGSFVKKRGREVALGGAGCRGRGGECRGGEGGEPSVTPPRAAPRPPQVLIKAGLVKMYQ